MSETTQKLLTAVLNLSEQDRNELITALISAEHPMNDSIDDELMQIIERRSAEIESGEVQTVSWEEVKRRSRAANGG